MSTRMPRPIVEARATGLRELPFAPAAPVPTLATLGDAINRAKPAGAKGTYLKTLSIASTMGPGIRVDIPGVLAAAAAA